MTVGELNRTVFSSPLPPTTTASRRTAQYSSTTSSSASAATSCECEPGVGVGGRREEGREEGEKEKGQSSLRQEERGGDPNVPRSPSRGPRGPHEPVRGEREKGLSVSFDERKGREKTTTPLGELALLHTLTDEPVNEGTLRVEQVELAVEAR
jgi:hypothetical protein